MTKQCKLLKLKTLTKKEFVLKRINLLILEKLLFKPSNQKLNPRKTPSMISIPTTPNQTEKCLASPIPWTNTLAQEEAKR
jgi:predicted butyrate kinase (DUF1464 family)